MREGKKIREDLRRELERYMDSVYRYLDEHLKRIEKSLESLEIDDLYIFQTTWLRSWSVSDADVSGGISGSMMPWGFTLLTHIFVLF